MRIRSTILSLLVGTLLPCGFPAPAVAQQPSSMTVCDLVQDYSGVSGKLVAIHAELNINRHGSSLSDPSCAGTFRMAGRDWPIAVNLGKPDANAQEQHASAADLRSVEF